MERARSFIQKIFKEGAGTIELELICKDGRRVPTEYRVSVIEDDRGEPKYIISIGRDITERKAIEERLTKERDRAQMYLDIAGVMIVALNAEGKVTLINRKGCEILGYDEDEITGKSWFDNFLLQKDIDKVRDVFQQLMQGNLGPLEYKENPVITKSGQKKLIAWHNALLKNQKNEIIGTLSSGEDITESKRAEEEREKLQVQLSNAVEIAHLGHWEYDVAKDLFTFNDHFYKIFRTTAEEVGGYTISSAEYTRLFVHPDDSHLVAEETRKAVEITDPNFKRQLEHRIIYTDGTIGHISVQFFVVKDEQGKTVKTYGVNQDITERKRMEEELLRTQKLESVGILAGGIAHDFNNILTAIIGNISLAKNQVTPEDEIFELLNEAEMASTRAQGLTKQLLTFAKGGTPVKETASIRDIIKESALFALRGSKSSGEFSISEDLWPVEVDIGQFNQVINNIVINAIQAMPLGGTIKFAVENQNIEEKDSLPVKPGRYVGISITDQGIGIAEEYLSKIFDPYFTTKQKGSGLGLATTYSIIRRHDGYIKVESKLGVGTTFHIRLPASEKAIPEKEEVRLIKGQGRILVMDDEASLRRTAGRMLDILGYEPEFAKDGDEAIQMVKEAREAKKPYDAIILDLTVPGGMGGKECIARLLEIDPEVKAIVSSGYSEDLVLANFHEHGFKGMMPKPFETRSLSKVLHDVLKSEKE